MTAIMKTNLKKIVNIIYDDIKIEKNSLIPLLITVACTVSLCCVLHYLGVFVVNEKESVTVGFMCNGDESTSHSEDFLRVVDILELKFGSKVNVVVKSNVPELYAEQVLNELMEENCDIIFSNSYEFGDDLKKFAQSHPKTEFCQATCSNANEEPLLKNYHTFMGRIYEGWYISGRVAGFQLKQMIDNGEITDEEAWLGFVAAYPNSEVITDYTAFVLGAIRECESAKIKVRYTNSWSNYSEEYRTANLLIEEGCIIISQDTDTSGTAVACENTKVGHAVYHISYNQDMLYNAPNSTLVGARIDWSPYICSAVEAVITNKKIKKNVEGSIHGNDSGGGFNEGWVKMLDLNRAVAPDGSEDIIDESINEFKKDICSVFYGDYQGKNPNNENDVCDLNTVYKECRYQSAPSFHYIINDIVIIEE